MTEEEKNQYLENLLDEFYNVEYEDIIGGGQVRTKFRYRKVASADFGLTDEEILLLEDKQLNRLVSLKKYRPYLDTVDPNAQHCEREEGEIDKKKRRQIEGEVNPHRVKHVKREYQEEIEEKKVNFIKISYMFIEIIEIIFNDFR